MMNLNQGILARITIPLPSLTIQKAIVAEIEIEQKLVKATRALIARFERKIADTFDRVWADDRVAAADD